MSLNDKPYMQLADSVVVGRIMRAAAVPVRMSWMCIKDAIGTSVTSRQRGASVAFGPKRTSAERL